MTRFSAAALLRGECRARTSCDWGAVRHTAEDAIAARAAADAAFEPAPGERDLAAAERAAEDVSTMAEAVRRDAADTAQFLDAWQRDPGRPQRQAGQPAHIAVCDGRLYG